MGTVGESDWEELYGILFAQAPVGVLVFDRDRVVVDVNERLLAILATTRKQVVGLDLSSLRDRSALAAVDRALAGEPATYEGPYKATTSDAEVVVSIRTAPLRGRGSAVVGGVAMVEDITERRAAEDALKRSEARFRRLIEAAPDAACLIVDGRFVYANPALLAQLGATETELLGTPVIDVAHPDDRADVIARMAARADGVPPSPFEYRGVRRDGTVFFVEVVSMRVEHEGRPALVAISRDVTARRAMQARLLQADRMLTMGTLAAGVAHEITNPLAYLAANLTYLADKQLPAIADVVARQNERLARHGEPPIDGDPVLERARELLATAQKGADRVREIVRDLRTFSRDDDVRTRVDLRRVIDACVDLAEHELVGRARVVRDYGPVPRVRASESRMGQVFLNLLVNAAQAIDSKGPESHTITIRTGADAEGRAVVSVSDTGAGIPAAVRERIFEPFFTTKPAGVGTGLGLWICADIVQRTGGTIEVASEPGAGATFTVTFPPDVEETDAESPTPPRAARARILVVDDEVALGRILASLLADEFDVEHASGGREALDILRRDPRFDAILCDLVMPQMSGAELFAELERSAPELARRVVFATGGTFGGASLAPLAGAKNPRLEKPFELEQLRAVLRRTVGSPRLVQPRAG